MALKTDGTLWVWGFNINGQVGNGTTINRTTPLRISF
ncbi:MAG: RCC1 domain-containing protein [Treponema sp.]|nr:RCC1 domain-containing protein [Treponema sp.]